MKEDLLCSQTVALGIMITYFIGKKIIMNSLHAMVKFVSRL
jgi:hypothetical protein